MSKQQGFLATFRIDEDLWGKFKDIAKTNRTNASALIVGYIESVVNAGEVVDFGVAGQGIDSLSIQNIDKLIDERIKSVQDIDSLSIQQIDLRIDERIKCLQQSTNSLSVQDIDKRIDEKLGGIESIAKKLIGESIPVFPDEGELSQLIKNEIANSLNEGDIAAKLERNRENLVNHLNEINDRLVKVESAVIENEKPKPTTTKKPDSTNTKKAEPTNNKKEPTEEDKADIIKALSIQKILSGEEKYSKNSSKLFDLIEQHKVEIESKLGIKIGDMEKYPVKAINQILDALGCEYDFKQPTVNGKRLSEYFVIQK